MKTKSYNLFVVSSVAILILSLITLFVLREKKIQERESVFLNRIAIDKNTIDFNNLTPIELGVWEKFEKIPAHKYSIYYKEIAENNRVLLNSSSSQKIGIYILKKVLNDGDLSPQEKLFILNKLRALVASSENIVNTIKISIEYLNLAEDLNSEYDIVRAKIALSSIFLSLGGFETSIKLLDELDIENKNFPEIDRIKCSINLYLAENYFFLKDYDKALSYIAKVPPLNGEDVDYRYNVLTLKNLLTTRIYIDLNNQEKASVSLDTATNLLKDIEKIYFTDLRKFYLLTLENYYSKYNPKKFSPNKLYEFIKNPQNHGDIMFLKMAFNPLFHYYYESNQFKKYNDLLADYENYLNKINITNNKVFTLYLIENLERERFAQENERLYKNIALLVLSMLAILGISFERVKFLEKKSKLDVLTDIGNRLAFNTKLKSLKDRDYSMLLFDIDNFKKINDTYGHEFGDEVLSTIGKILKTIENKEISIYRVGGEEFVIIFTHLNRTFATESCEYIRKSVENVHWKNPITVTISGGFSTAADNTYAQCDVRLYRAKSSGKNMIIYQDVSSREA